MKLENLLALYLYQNKKLNLPGIGIFTADNTVTVPDDNEKHPTAVQGISFTNANVQMPDDDFIDFIKLHTGKMKPLAMSDLESYLMLSKQFLNIGKPFYIDGVGTLQKANDGSLKFTPGNYVSTKLEVPGAEKKIAESHKKSMGGDEHRDHAKSSTGSNKGLLLLGLIATLLLAGWGGYYLFKNGSSNKSSGEAGSEVLGIDTLTNNAVSQDTLSSSLIPDSIAMRLDSSVIAPAGSYKYVVETTTNKTRALKRFNDLKSYNKAYQLETTDSVLFKIFLIKNSLPTDTIRIKDSLNSWYYGTKEMKVKIE